MSEDQYITAREFDAAMRALTNAMAEGFSGINQRLDRVNGRLDKHDTSIGLLTPRVAEHGVKITNLNREVFPQGRDTPPVLPHVDKDNDAPITMRDMKRALWVAGAVLAGLGALVKYGPVILKVMANDAAGGM